MDGVTVDALYLAKALQALTTAVNEAAHFRQVAIDLNAQVKEQAVGEAPDETPDEGEEVPVVRKARVKGKE